MVAVVGIISRCSLRINACHRIQPNKSKLVLHISLYFHFNNCLKQLYISNKMELFSYKDGCGVRVHRTCIDTNGFRLLVI